MPDTHWSTWVAACENAGTPYVLVTVLGARGSTPRDAGTKMVVQADRFFGTIGGGELEFRALHRARELLADARAPDRERGPPVQEVEHFPLGEKLGQCCGGSVSLLFELARPAHPPVYLFGAGHVGRALAPLLATLPLRVTWVDAREGEFPEALPAGVERQVDEDPVRALRDAPMGTAFVIMTHNHPLDYRLAEAALERQDATYIGVIGSQSKARRFRLRLAHRGLTEARIRDLICPIGLEEIPGKRPQEIAISVAGQIIAHYHRLQTSERPAPGPRWKELRASLGRAASTEKAVTDDATPASPAGDDRSPTS